jgi:hypothetical protein
LEPRQPGNIDFDILARLFPEKVHLFSPTQWLWYDRTDPGRLGEIEYRYAIRYQYAWERSDSEYLFITHNDVLYTGDIIGSFLGKIGENAAIGEIGQCWNCPASAADLCDGDRYLHFRPSGAEVKGLYSKYPTKRSNWREYLDEESPWPLPECRVNEWAALVNLTMAKPETVPFGTAMPFGAVFLDVGTHWFRDMALKGFTFANASIRGLAQHGWASSGAGHDALYNFSKYEAGEAAAFQLLVDEYGISRSELEQAAGARWRNRLRTAMRRLIGR